MPKLQRSKVCLSKSEFIGIRTLQSLTPTNNMNKSHVNWIIYFSVVPSVSNSVYCAPPTSSSDWLGLPSLFDSVFLPSFFLAPVAFSCVLSQQWIVPTLMANPAVPESLPVLSSFVCLLLSLLFFDIVQLQRVLPRLCSGCLLSFSVTSFHWLILFTVLLAFGSISFDNNSSLVLWFVNMVRMVNFSFFLASIHDSCVTRE